MVPILGAGDDTVRTGLVGIRGHGLFGLGGSVHSNPDGVITGCLTPVTVGGLEMLDDKLDVPPPPVLILSSSAATDDVERSYEKGGNAYLTKPDDMSEYTSIAESIKDFWLGQVRPPVPFS